jgi:predicted DCC family thiol-disulfide oxidoreductase YuxK
VSARPADPSASSSAEPSAEATPRAVTVFYDGACPLCSAEIGFYRRRRGADRVGWVDVSACPTEVVAPGLTRDQALKRFHVRDAGGRLVSGGQAFAVLWSALPAFAWIGRLFRLRPLAWAIDRAYDGFLNWRPRLQAVARRTTRSVR